MLRVVDLSVSYMLNTSIATTRVIEGMSFEIPKGGYCSVVGPSGCGKTTLLLCIAGLVQPAGGKIELDGMSAAKVREGHRIGLVFQKPVFFEWKTVLANVALAAEISGKEGANNQASRYLKEFHSDGFASAFPHELSGGMLSRAALARAFVHEPDYLLLDEAFNHLDEALRDTINLDIQSLWLNRKPTVVAVTHSISEAILMSDCVLVMSRKPSRILRSFDVPFERPRLTSLRADPRFTALAEEIRATLGLAYREAGDALN
jgi:NitT/TauT family transport system ATP-binding protein